MEMDNDTPAQIPPSGLQDPDNPTPNPPPSLANWSRLPASQAHDQTEVYGRLFARQAIKHQKRIPFSTALVSGANSIPIAKAKEKEINKKIIRTALLHRIRFIDWSPSSITALALTPPTWDPKVAFPSMPSIHATTPSTSTAAGREVLAVARQCGSVEIYVWIGGEGSIRGGKSGNGNGKRQTQANRQGWVLIKTLAAPYPSRVEHLVFTHQYSLSPNDLDLLDEGEEQQRELEKLTRARPRLFSAGGGSDVWEWDWQDGGIATVSRTLSSQGGAIWSMAVNPSHTKLALGCDDGAVRIISLLDGEFEHVRKLDGCKSRLLSIAWGPMRRVVSKGKGKGKARGGGATDDDMSGEDRVNDDDDDDAFLQTSWEDSYIATGCADSSVRKWDTQTGRCEFKMTTDKLQGEQTLVWACAALPDGTIVSGDSMGNVKYWDAEFGTQLQNVKAHDADVLCLTVGPDGKSVYSTGVDQKVTQMQYVDITATNGDAQSTQKRARWESTHTRRLHTHDVRAIAISPSAILPGPLLPPRIVERALQQTIVPILITGGLDFSPVFTPAGTVGNDRRPPNPVSDGSTTFSAAYQRQAPFIPHRNSPIALSRQSNVITCRKDNTVDIWSRPQANGATSESGKWEKVLELQVKVSTSLLSSCVSPDGRWLVVSDAYEARLFRLSQSKKDGKLKAKRNDSFSSLIASHTILKDDAASTQIAFSPDSGKLILATVAGSRLVVLALPDTSAGSVEVLRIFEQHRHSRAVGIAGRVLAGSRKLPNGINGHKRTALDDSDGSSDEQSEEGTQDDSDTGTEEADMEGEMISTITNMTVSLDGQWLASVDCARRLHVFNLDSLQHHGTLPSLDLPASALAFSPTTASLLAVGLANNTVNFFDVETRCIPWWAQNLANRPSGALTVLRDPLMGMAYDPIPAEPTKNVLILYGATWLCKMIVPSMSTVDQAHQINSREAPSTVKRKEMSDDDEDTVEGGQEAAAVPRQKMRIPRSTIQTEVFHKYHSILMVDFNAKGELIVVERPYFTMLGQMAPAFVGKKYGRS